MRSTCSRSRNCKPMLSSTSICSSNFMRERDNVRDHRARYRNRLVHLSNDLPSSYFRAPSNYVTRKLDTRFDRPNSTMNREQCFQKLGLSRYQLYLSLTSRIYGRWGINEYEYLTCNKEYSIVIEENHNTNTTSLVLTTPKHPAGRSVQISYER